jgi:hypothetical protein
MDFVVADEDVSLVMAAGYVLGGQDLERAATIQAADLVLQDFQLAGQIGIGVYEPLRKLKIVTA